MSQKFTKQTLKMVVSQICQTIGWHAIQTTSLEVLIDVLHRYLEEIAKTAHLYADQFGRTRPNLDDLGLAFSGMGIEIRELEEYVEFVESVPCNYKVPKYPIPKESHLNFLKPGSKEVVTRPVHVHEHLPPTIVETEEEYLPNDGQLVVDTTGLTSTPSPQASPQSVFKRPGDPIESPVAKRARLFLEEEGRPLREISSVMMTTGGLLSPAREGKLPEAKVVLPTSDSRSVSPQPSSYPVVPPEVNRDKKVKKLPTDPVKTEKKKEKKMMDKIDMPGEPMVKKLASMKEMGKLKPLKTGALKMQPRYSQVPNKVPKASPTKMVSPEITPEKSLIQKLSESPHLVVTPVQSNARRPSPPPFEKNRDPGVTIAKLTTEPDTQKLNIFKKISKVKEEKVEKLEKHDFADLVPPVHRERSPGLIIEEIPNRRPRSALSEIMEALPKDKKESKVPKVEPRPLDVASVYSDTLSSPGSPSTPKTPEIMRKPEKSPEHKKKKKDKEKKKKKNVPKEKIKMEDDSDKDKSDRPMTPEIQESPKIKDPLTNLGFPFSFPSGPSLIPPPISRFGLVPDFPNLSLPPPFLMQKPIKLEDIKKEKIDKSDKPMSLAMGGLSPPLRMEKEGKSPLEILFNRDKSLDKKMKEYKKEKKDKDKIKKKKDKKEKIKKEKGEKKHKDDKHKEHKSKEKKEKKIKKKDKLKEGKSPIVSVPKLTLKLGPSSPRPPSPEPKLKKFREDDDRPMSPAREPSPEIARISNLFNKPPKTSVTKLLHVQTELPKMSLLAPKETVPVMKSPGTIIDKDGNKVWICPACGQRDDGSAMIGCDECDAWYHWVCVGIQVPPDTNEDWYCRFCIAKKQGAHPEKKKRGRKKKPPV
ncbi:UNVERIFIED_CONTAM: hypothetical protein PYX00_007701 [Menopon gallinae]|uniref:PHD-type domain-containing protein n=1 Tax=Menopon gallinae TaxID=328185 RepID=A0AAW2HK03_9NEOP